MKINHNLSIILLLVLLPLSVMAMTPVTDSDLADVTGQAGVNINADLQMDLTMDSAAWGDSDGIGVLSAYGWDATTNGGYTGVTDFNITNLRIKARETDSYNGYTTAMLKPITIDVASDTEGVLYGGRTFVRLGIGSLQTTIDELSFNVAFGPNPAAMTEISGTVNLGSIAVYFNPESYIDIYAHDGQGVNLTFNVIIDEWALDYASWGDADGLPAGNTGTGGVVWMASGPSMTAGYVGGKNISWGVISITGTAVIDVATSAAGAYAHGAPGTPTTVVHIGFTDNFTLAVDGPVTWDVRLANNPALDNVLAGNVASTLGNIYLSELSLAVYDGSWVDIWAH